MCSGWTEQGAIRKAQRHLRAAITGLRALAPARLRECCYRTAATSPGRRKRAGPVPTTPPLSRNRPGKPKLCNFKARSECGRI